MSRRRSGESPQRRRKRQMLWLLGALGGAWLLLMLCLWATVGRTVSLEGRLVELRGHAGEVHLVIRLDSPLAGGRVRYAEAVVPDYRFARELADYTDAEERPQGGDRVAIEGKRQDPADARFTLVDPGQALFVELSAIQKDGDPRSRAVVGRQRRRSTFASAPARTKLASMLRIHPMPGQNVGFAGRYAGWRQQGVEVLGSLTDRRPVLVEFPGKSADDFSLYQTDDEVYIVGMLSQSASPGRLVLRGSSIRRLEEPNAPIFVDSGG